MFMQCLEIITIGLPFCAFKCITGLFFHQHWLVVLGIIDLLINVINLLTVMTRKKRALDACLLSLIVRKIKKPEQDFKHHWQDLGNSLDVLLSFILVAYVIGSGAIVELPVSHTVIWNIAVVLNVLGAGSSRLTQSIRNLRPDTKMEPLT